MIYRIICLVIFLAISLATDVIVYKSDDYSSQTKREPLVRSQFPLKFRFPSNLFRITIKIFPKNISPSVKVIYVTYKSDNGPNIAMSKKEKTGRRQNETYFLVREGAIKSIYINLHFKPTVLCPSILVAEGRDISQLTNETAEEFESIDECITDICELEVDLRNECEDHPSNVTIKDNVNTTSTPPMNTVTSDNSTIRDKNFEKNTDNNAASHADDPSQLSSGNKVLMYVIPSVIVVCVLILVIYINVKKYYRRNPDPVKTMELDSYVTINEVVYADLSFARGDSQPRHGEEVTYAQIIGVLKPQKS